MDNQTINNHLDKLVNNEAGQIRISYKQAIFLLNNGINGDTMPSLRKECTDDSDFMGIYIDDIECLDDSEHFQLWYDSI